MLQLVDCDLLVPNKKLASTCRNRFGVEETLKHESFEDACAKGEKGRYTLWRRNLLLRPEPRVIASLLLFFVACFRFAKERLPAYSYFTNCLVRYSRTPSFSRYFLNSSRLASILFPELPLVDMVYSTVFMHKFKYKSCKR